MTRETAHETRLREWAKARGGRAIKLNYCAGIPDRLVILPGGFSAFVELKTDSKPTRLQLYWRWWLERNGFQAFICYDVGALIDEMETAWLSKTNGRISKK